jgi:hypothetical protein
MKSGFLFYGFPRFARTYIDRFQLGEKLLQRRLEAFTVKTRRVRFVNG